MATHSVERAAKRTYTLDPQTVQRFEELVPAGSRSQVVEKLLASHVSEMERLKRRQLIHEGLEYMADVIEETMSEWESADEEHWPTA